jgi:putative tryptophan/tyrosine transport system substrate-binding protein
MNLRRQLLATFALCALAAPLRSFAQQQSKSRRADPDAAPLGVEAQHAGKVYRIGVLETTSLGMNAANFDAFRRGLRELGYTEGKNLIIEYRSAEGRGERFPELATELVRLKVDVIVTRGTPAVVVASKFAGTIPVVMAAIGEPPGRGIVASLARPGGNITGLSAFVTELTAKRLEMLRELAPRVTRVATLLNMGNPISPGQWQETQRATQSMGIRPQLLDVRKPEELGPALDEAIKQRANGLVVGIDALTQANAKTIAELAAKHRLPAIYASKEFVESGGLISYGVSYPDLYYRAARFVDKILKGAKPADLPVEQPTKYELVINRKTAAGLKLAIPQQLLLRADEVIE